ncbi:MAG: hypothetical protein KDI88_05045 [Gammaproteobacteria bacterium]|nr:hypothetical protein [Gammaproteobacteria bacterium]
MQRSLRVFYRDYVNAVTIASSQPESLSADRVSALADRLLVSEDNFIGVVDRNDVILQGYVDDDGDCIVLEMVYPEATGCLRLALPRADALDLLGDLPDVFDASLLAGAQYID